MMMEDFALEEEDELADMDLPQLSMGMPTLNKQIWLI